MIKKREQFPSYTKRPSVARCYDDCNNDDNQDKCLLINKLFKHFYHFLAAQWYNPIKKTIEKRRSLLK